MNKKAFTVVEMAIVLVIIGVMIAMVLKGLNLHHSAQVRREMTRMKTFESAINGFYAFSGSIISDFETDTNYCRYCLDLDDMITAGFLKDEDLRSNLTESRWALYSCMSATTGWSVYNLGGLDPLSTSMPINICASPSDLDDYSVTEEFACMMEFTFDDDSVDTGKGRYVTQVGTSFLGNHSGSSEKLYDNCSRYDGETGYAWEVFTAPYNKL